MYRLKYVKRKYDKHDAIALMKGSKQIASVVFEKNPTIEDVFRIRNKTDLYLDWYDLWDKFKRNVFVRECEICNKQFESKYPNQKYCSDKCKTEGRKLRQKKYYEDNRLKILKKAYERRLFIKNQNRNILNEEFINKGYLPDGFNQIDNQNDLGESGLREHRNADYDIELKLVEKELKRFNLLYSFYKM